MQDEEIYPTQAEYYMSECFELAREGLGRTSPNPVVGAIILNKEGIPVGKGFHKKSGDEHAEVIALKEAGASASEGTLIVNLEPCCHYGKTPPCTEIIIKSRLKEVIFSNHDPNPEVNKKGEKTLTDNGIKVIKGVLEEEGKEVNKFFFKWISKRLPWVALKQAQTLDGRVALDNKKSKWITGDIARKEVHSLRNIYDAVLIGASTVQNDNPELTVRNIENGRNPVRVILDKDLKSQPDTNVYNPNSKVLLVTKKGHSTTELNKYIKRNKNLSVIELTPLKSGRLDLKELFTVLGSEGVLSLLVEGGPNLSGELILNGLVDEYILFIAPIVFGDISAVPSLKISQIDEISQSYKFMLHSYKKIGNDLMLSLRPN